MASNTLLGHNLAVLRWHFFHTGPAGAGEHYPLGMFVPSFVGSPATEKYVTISAKLLHWHQQAAFFLALVFVAYGAGYSIADTFDCR